MTPREQIDRCILAYTRGIDRLDGELIASAFHPGATLEGYGSSGETTIEAFVDQALTSLRERFDATQHRVSNTRVVWGDRDAAVETYVLAFHTQLQDEGPDRLLTFNGRYLDRFTEVDGEWRIARRRLRKDWSRIEDIQASMPGDWTYGTRDRTDASYD